MTGNALLQNIEPVVPVGVPHLDLTADIETWLQTQVEPEVPLLWRGLPVRNTVELTDRVSALAHAGFGALETPARFPWAQCMRVDGGFVVEVCGCGGPESWARRVYPIGSRGPDGLRLRSRAHDAQDGEPTGTSFLDGENIPTASGAAQVLWSWVKNGTLPAGYQLRDVDPRSE